MVQPIDNKYIQDIWFEFLPQGNNVETVVTVSDFDVLERTYNFTTKNNDTGYFCCASILELDLIDLQHNIDDVQYWCKTYTRLCDDNGILYSSQQVSDIFEMVQTRIKKLGEIPSLIRFFFQDYPEYDSSLLVSFKKTAEEIHNILSKVLTAIEKTSVWTDITTLNNALRDIADSLNVSYRDFFMPIRIAITGSTQSLPLIESMFILGKRKSVSRLHYSMQKLTQLINKGRTQSEEKV